MEFHAMKFEGIVTFQISFPEFAHKSLGPSERSGEIWNEFKSRALLSNLSLINIWRLGQKSLCLGGARKEKKCTLGSSLQ